MMNMLLSYVINSEDIKHYTVKVYYNLLRLMQEERVEDYYELKAIIYSKDSFDNHELRQLFTFLTNFCIRKIDHGDDRFVQERFELWKKSLEKGVVTDGVQFAETRFIGIVISGLEANQPEWVDDFIQQYSQELGLDVRENTVNYSKALCAFYAGKYDTARDFLHDITTIDIIARIAIKTLLIKIYYDNNELNLRNMDIHPINSELKALQQLTRCGSNTKMSERIRLHKVNFANFFKRILNRKKKIIEKRPPTRKNIETLKTELAKIQPLKERKWLNDKLDELIEAVKS